MTTPKKDFMRSTTPMRMDKPLNSRAKDLCVSVGVAMDSEHALHNGSIPFSRTY